MIDTFKIKADVLGNNLLIQLRGYFMMSELELAFHLAREESTHLTEGFIVLLDLDGMYTDKSLFNTIQLRLVKMFSALGASNVKSIGAIPQMLNKNIADMQHILFSGVGYYPN
jgi:hypothetical protein